MRLLIVSPNYASRYNHGHERFRDELSRQCDVVRLGHKYPNWDGCLSIPQMIADHGPFDALLLFHPKHLKNFTGIETVSIPKVCVITDYFPRNSAEKNTWLDCSRINLVVVRQQFQFRQFVASKKVGSLRKTMQGVWLPWSIDHKFFCPNGAERTNDVAAIFTTTPENIYPTRAMALRHIQAMNVTSITKAANGNPNRFRGKDYVNVFASSKIGINTSDSTGFASQKCMEIPACGAVLFSEPAEDLKPLGYVNGKNFVEFPTIANMKRLILGYLKRPEKLQALAKKGRDLVLSRHTNEIRVKEFLRILQEKL